MGLDGATAASKREHKGEGERPHGCTSVRMVPNASTMNRGSAECHLLAMLEAGRAQGIARRCVAALFGQRDAQRVHCSDPSESAPNGRRQNDPST
jgi:hypothetical protein